MRAWLADNYDTFGCHDNDDLYIVHAETAGKARAQLACDMGCEFVHVRMRRLPALDDLPQTDYNLLALGIAGWVDCAGFQCRRKIRAADPSSGMADATRLWWYYDGDDWQDHDEYQMAHHVEGVGMFCTPECYQRSRAALP